MGIRKWRVIDMTIDERAIDEAIAHAREVAKHKRKKLDECNKKNNYACKFCIEIRTCKEVAEEQEQLVELLEELKAYKSLSPMELVSEKQKNDRVMEYNKGFDYGFKTGYNKAIYDFAEKLKQDVMAITLGLRICDIDRIAEQLKVGVKE